jgi:hypothetical protein
MALIYLDYNASTLIGPAVAAANSRSRWHASDAGDGFEPRAMGRFLTGATHLGCSFVSWGKDARFLQIG